MNDPAPTWLTGLGITITPSTSAGPGFTLNRDDAMSMLRLAKQARDQLRDMRATAANLGRLTPPADDPASTAYNTRLVGDGQATGAFGAGVAHVDQMYTYTADLVVKLQQALGITENADRTAADDVRPSSPGGRPG
ncbi:hypothetical protein [Amycolatopsis jejuensis]|uniref:hypothetical protein n=1 Tax=Amycolatopsis jejuensis TaxID=330084 RepID=UPI000689D265|nr:hypothetical protein [Amycolatopsis jejuensis]